MVLQFDLLTFVCVCVCVYGMQRKRLTLLMAAALFQGASIGPLIDLAIQIDPSQGKLSLHLWLPEELFLSSSPYRSLYSKFKIQSLEQFPIKC
jgi:hypothetical protein